MPTITAPSLQLSLVDLRSSLVLAISDLSTYYGTALTSADVSMQITVPGYTDVVNVPFNPGQVNVYECSDLGITCGDCTCCELPDGIYNVIYTVQPTPWNVADPLPFIQQSFIKIDKILCRYYHAFTKIDLELCCAGIDKDKESKIRQLLKIKLYIYAAVAEHNNSNYKMAYKYYHKASQLLDQIKCGKEVKGCGCN